MKPRVTDRQLLVAAYAYSGLHVMTWWLLVSSSGEEWWFTLLEIAAGLAFLPLNILAGILCRVVWGSFNIFSARFVFGLVTDVAVASLLSTSLIVWPWLFIRGWRWARGQRRGGRPVR